MEWAQARTDKLVEGIGGIIIKPVGLGWAYQWDKEFFYRKDFIPATDMNHALMFVESEWFKKGYAWDSTSDTGDRGGYHVFIYSTKGSRKMIVDAWGKTLHLAICLALEKLFLEA